MKSLRLAKSGQHVGMELVVGRVCWVRWVTQHCGDVLAWDRAWMRGLQRPAAHSLAMKCLKKDEMLWANLWHLSSLCQQISAQSDGAAPARSPHLCCCWCINPTSRSFLDHPSRDKDFYLWKRLWWNTARADIQEGTSSFPYCSALGAGREWRQMCQEGLSCL